MTADATLHTYNDNIITFCDDITLTERREIQEHLKLGYDKRLPITYIATTLFLLGHKYFSINGNRYGDDEEIDIMGSFNYTIDEDDEDD